MREGNDLPAGTELEPSVKVERRGRVLVVIINRPRAKNALNYEVARQVASSMEVLDSSPDLSVGVITGAGGDFSAGMDLKAFVAGESPILERGGLCGITNKPPRKPLVAAVEGWALAGGFELLLACDLVVAADTARLGLPEVRRGLVAAEGGAFLLPKRIPLTIAMELLLVGAPISARRGYDLGLVNRLTAPGEALDEAMRLANDIARNAPLALEATKTIARTSEWDGPSGWLAQSTLAARVLGSADAREGSEAFSERRDPQWRGQ